jgi:molecular chaperone GrpE
MTAKKNDNKDELKKSKEGLSSKKDKAKPNELSLLQDKYDKTYDSLLRAKAEVENIKKRSQKDVESAYKFSTESLLQEIIPVYDSLDLSSKLADESLTTAQVKEGNKLILTMFQKIFEKNNIKEINPLNESFNPEFHQAISTNKDTTKKNDVISEVVQKGYMLNGRVVKPALVIVIKNS